jgi:limonene-1,2-epoxide hydrolase
MAADPVEKFWKALAQSDGEAMARCYARDATFRDPVFRLRGKDVGAMWRMLMPPGSAVQVTTQPLARHRDTVTGRWGATYTFPATGRAVHNRITSTFTVERGRIVHQRDRFSFWRWSRMALGPVGLWIGWTPLVRVQVRKQARRQLERWQAAQRRD